MALLLTAAASAGAHGSALRPYVAVAGETSFDSNVRNGNGPDLVNRVVPEIGFHLKLPLLTFVAKYDAAYFDYTFGTAENSWNHALELSADLLATERTTLSAADRLVVAHDPATVDLATPELVTGSIVDESAQTALTYAATHRLTIAPSVSLRAIRLSGVYSEFDSTQIVPGLDTAYLLGHQETLHLGDALHVFTGPGSNGLSQEPSLGLTVLFSARLDAFAAAGPALFQSSPATGLTWHAAGHVRYAGERYRMAVSYARDLAAGGAPETLWAEDASAQLTGLLTRRSWLRLFGVGYRDGVAPNGSTLIRGLAVEGEVDDAFRRDLLIGLYTVLRAQQISIPPFGAYLSAGRVIVGLRVMGAWGSDVKELVEAP